MVANPTDTFVDNLEHYNSIARGYDDLHRYWTSRCADLAVKWLAIQPQDKIADIGGGTGAIAEAIKMKCDLQSDILVIDPSPESIKIAEGKEGVRGMVADADQFLATQDSKDYNKYLFIGVVHHFTDEKKTFESAYQCLPKGGEILIICRKYKHFPPLWNRAYSLLIGNYSTPETNIEALKEASFTVISEEEGKKEILVKREYFDQLRRRNFSNLHSLTDEEIEEGLRELDEVVFKGKDSIIFEHIITVIKAAKTD